MGLMRRFARQILEALRFLRSHGIIHCDMKPENILLQQPKKSQLKVIDLGSSCFQDERVYTYIQSRFYRAPEIMLGIPYTTAIDMWSFGCIMAELCLGLPLFPGESEQEQLALIMETRGLPPKHMLAEAGRKKLFFDGRNNPLLEPDGSGKLHFPGTQTLFQRLKTADKKFVQFVSVWLLTSVS